ncbi:tetratricopeptide repeat protein [Desulfovibrio psychrotolerans]|nr:tetratricopeptide repeat protein [Desulfovibrio psychrotolerans]
MSSACKADVSAMACAFTEKPMRGVFSLEQAAVIGHGTTKRTTVSVQYFYALEEDDGRFSVRLVNDKHLPTGDAEYLTLEEILERYNPEPGMYHEKVFPAMREIAKMVARGERHLTNGEPYSAEMEFLAALKLDEDHVRATFGLGLAYLARQQTEKADKVFQKLVKMRAAFEEEHKHMFNTFGIQLRKNGMYPQALKFYARAQQLCGADDHLMFNMARCLCEVGDAENSCKYLHKALELNPGLTEASRLLRSLEKGSCNLA